MMRMIKVRKDSAKNRRKQRESGSESDKGKRR